MNSSPSLWMERQTLREGWEFVQSHTMRSDKQGLTFRLLTAGAGSSPFHSDGDALLMEGDRQGWGVAGRGLLHIACPEL